MHRRTPVIGHPIPIDATGRRRNGPGGAVPAESVLGEAPFDAARIARMMRAEDGSMRVALVNVATGEEFATVPLSDRSHESIARVVGIVSRMRDTMANSTPPAPQPVPKRPRVAAPEEIKLRAQAVYDDAVSEFPAEDFDGGPTSGGILVGLPSFDELDELAAHGRLREGVARVVLAEARLAAARRGEDPSTITEGVAFAPPGSFASFVRSRQTPFADRFGKPQPEETRRRRRRTFDDVYAWYRNLPSHHVLKPDDFSEPIWIEDVAGSGMPAEVTVDAVRALPLGWMLGSRWDGKTINGAVSNAVRLAISNARSDEEFLFVPVVAGTTASPTTPIVTLVARREPDRIVLDKPTREQRVDARVAAALARTNRYGLNARPAGIGNVPDGPYEVFPADRQNGLPYQFGLIRYPEPLSLRSVRAYGLTPHWPSEMTAIAALADVSPKTVKSLVELLREQPSTRGGIARHIHRAAEDESLYARFPVTGQYSGDDLVPHFVRLHGLTVRPEPTDDYGRKDNGARRSSARDTATLDLFAPRPAAEPRPAHPPQAPTASPSETSAASQACQLPAPLRRLHNGYTEAWGPVAAQQHRWFVDTYKIIKSDRGVVIQGSSPDGKLTGMCDRCGTSISNVFVFSDDSGRSLMHVGIDCAGKMGVSLEELKRAKEAMRHLETAEERKARLLQRGEAEAMRLAEARANIEANRDAVAEFNALSQRPDATEWERKTLGRAVDLIAERGGQWLEDPQNDLENDMRRHVSSIRDRLALSLTSRHVGAVGKPFQEALRAYRSSILLESQYGDKYLSFLTDDRGNAFLYKGAKPVPYRGVVRAVWTIAAHQHSREGVPETVLARPRKGTMTLPPRPWDEAQMEHVEAF